MEKPTPDSETMSARAGRSVTLVGALVNVLLILLKFFAGIFGNSQALIADAVHSLSDLFTDAIVLLGLRVGRKAPDAEHPFGHGRIETLASAIVGMALIATALYLGIEAALNIYRHTEYHPTNLALIGAGVSIALKEALYHYTVHIGRRIKSQLIIANAWHHRSDSLSSVAVFMGVAGALINPSLYILDSFAAILVSFFIVKVGLEILRDSLREFTDTAPPPEILNKISDCTRSVEGVLDTHDLRVRTSGGMYQMETHIVVDGQLTVSEGHRIAKAVESCLAEEIEDLDRVIVHVDPAIEEKEPE
ncbi:MAG: cation transporter [Deltaproteobacteria bacterium]|nr:cation transporter [Deltaproteobacteria bacterium]MBW1738193.1 cation transporter [Deltaproteobacteria bacterium]MBW1909088.1 cation transporter [Deltaproteobacteria bacterium]MBW2033004.1 cation transporter [Deltaproteobacteria bacterium]MBW2114728.1 cation transporter [Deltaproteobacteria bacterium]